MKSVLLIGIVGWIMSKRTTTAVWLDKHSRWQIKVQKDGIRKTFYSSKPGRTGQREANAKADKWLDGGALSNGGKIKDLFIEFTEDVKLNTSTSELARVKSFGKNWIIPNIGNKKIDKINDYDIQRLLDVAAAAGLSKKTIKNIKEAFNKFLKWCRRKGLTSYRPDDVTIPANTRLKGKKVLQPDDIAKLLKSDKTLYRGSEVTEPLVYAFRFSVLTGIRPGEQRGLKPEDINGNIVNIKRSINIHGETTKGKNENAIRSFVMSKQAAEALQDQQTHFPNKDFVFDLPSPSCLRDRLAAYCKHNGMTVITPYEMRHTFVSVVKALAPGEIKPIIGHSQDMDTFGIYSHFLQGEDEKTAEKISSLFSQIIELKKEQETQSGL